jgi:transaldolase
MENPIMNLHKYGQSPWLDFIQRKLVRSGELARMVDQWGLSGITSNPSIFERAIAHSNDYDDDINRFAKAGLDAGKIYEKLAITDICDAADLFRPIYDDSNGKDGFVSLEVSPHLAHDTEATVQEARRLWSLLDSPNILIKIPATPAGLPAISRLITEGINVNVTLLFSLDRYREVAGAYLEGIESAASNGLRVDQIASVASFFLSRIDTIVDPLLEEISSRNSSKAELAAALRGRVAVASAKCAYVIFEEIFHSERFRHLSDLGAQRQRLLWASTSTKNPGYSDIKYVEPLIGSYTVNTMTLDTLKAYIDRGNPAQRLDDGVPEARLVLDDLSEVGVDIDILTKRLLVEGLTKFINPFDALHKAIDEKRREVPGNG